MHCSSRQRVTAMKEPQAKRRDFSCKPPAALLRRRCSHSLLLHKRPIHQDPFASSCRRPPAKALIWVHGRWRAP